MATRLWHSEERSTEDWNNIVSAGEVKVQYYSVLCAARRWRCDAEDGEKQEEL